MEGNKYIIYILLFLILCTSSFSAYKVLRHYELYANDPLVGGAITYDIRECSCTTNTPGKFIDFNQEHVVQRMEGKTDTYNQYEEVDWAVLNLTPQN